MQIQKNKIRLYHLSDKNHNNEIFKPRLPKCMIDDPNFEDQKTKRVCFASSMTGAFKAINICWQRERLYVHVPINIDKIIKNRKLFKPSKKEVCDADSTGEYWIMQNVKLKCIGLADFYYSNSDPFGYYGDRIRIKWIEKY